MSYTVLLLYDNGLQLVLSVSRRSLKTWVLI